MEQMLFAEVISSVRPSRHGSWNDRLVMGSGGLKQGLFFGLASLGALAVLTLAIGAEVGLPRSHQMIEPRLGDAPVGVLIGRHVVVVMPGQVLLGPLGVEVRSLVLPVVVHERVDRGSGK